MNIKDHADLLANILETVINTHLAETSTAHVANEAIQDYRKSIGRQWLAAPEICEILSISRRTLIRWRQEKRIEPGKHWRRMGEGSHCLYDLKALEERMNQWAR